MSGIIVLLSGGLDSLVSLAEIVRREDKVIALTFDYGQVARKREIQASRKISRYYRIRHEIIKLDWLKNISTTPLVKDKKNIPLFSTSPERGARIVWVPNRNGVMVNIAGAFAEAAGYKKIAIGTNAEEGRFFSDNTIDFIEAANRFLYYSTRRHIKVVSITGKLKKREILQMGMKLKAPLQYLWSCYKGGKELCLECHSCVYIIKSLKEECIWDEFWKKRKRVRWN